MQTTASYLQLTTSHQSEREALCDALEDEIVTLASRMAAAEFRFLTCVRELEDVVCLIDCSYAEWLGWRCGMATSTAFERVRVARSLSELPAVSAAFAEGRLSYSKVRVITRIANAETDAAYCEQALLCSVRQLESLVAAHRSIDAAEACRHMQRRYVCLTTDDDGMVTLRGKLAPDDAALIRKALDAAHTDGVESSIDALVEVARAATSKLATGDDAILRVTLTPVVAPHAAPAAPPVADDSPRVDQTSHTAAPHSSRADHAPHATAPHSSRADHAPHATAPHSPRVDQTSHTAAPHSSGADHAPHAAATHSSRADNTPHTAAPHSPRADHAPHTTATRSPRGDHAQTQRHHHAAPCCSVEGFPIAGTTAERLLCEHPGRRGLSGSQRRVLLQRQHGCCAYPRCNHRRWLDGHHVIAWSQGGPTVVGNLVLLCRKHHRLLHEGQHTMHRENGHLLFLDARGRIIETSGTLPITGPADRDLATTVQPTRRLAGWDGERLDKDEAIGAILRVTDWQH